MLVFLIASTLAAIAASISIPPSNLILPQNLTTPNTVPANLTASNYYVIIENCGDDINAIDQRIRYAKTLALQGLSDTIFGVSGLYGFNAMFKRNEAVDAVQAILYAISQWKAKKGLIPDPVQLKAPRIACVAQDSASVYKSLKLDYDPWQRCLVGSPRSTPIAAFYAEGTAYLFLCPAYFVQKDKPDNSHCPVVHNNRFAGDPNALYKNYQVFTLIYGLARFYLGDNALDNDSDPPEQFDWNECVRLRVLDSIRNPTNLQIYTAFVSQKCTQFPEPPPMLLTSNSTLVTALPSGFATHDPFHGAATTLTAPSQTSASSAKANDSPQSSPAQPIFPDTAAAAVA